MSDLPDWKKLGPNEKADAILPLLAAGKTNLEIAARFLNCGSSQVSGLVNRMKAAGMNPAVRRVGWPKPKKTAAPTPQPKAKPAPKPDPAPISAKQGRKSGAPGGIPSKSLHKARDAKLNSANITNKAESRKIDPGLPVTITASAAWDALPDVEPITIDQLNSTTCRWPLWDDPGEPCLFCGAECEAERSFCPSHRALAYFPATVRQRASLRSAERIK